MPKATLVGSPTVQDTLLLSDHDYSPADSQSSLGKKKDMSERKREREKERERERERDRERER